ncbi:hypothetical protein CAEBREN_28885 [Caenorhabditis brenneri]|uniref:Bromo domain-containing protein n=1 Tax=Caenorhabditis brenneri TaxID=135651 RepID=G0PKP2_CAEBE|nr:hypothetical protein CAEBREN_28885 [Caenorhabditis brenneri]
MRDDEPRKSMVGAPPSRRGRGGNTPSAASSSTPAAPRSSARAAKRVKREEPEEDEYQNDPSDPEKSEEEESEDSADEVKTPSRKTPGGGTRKKKRVPLTDYHLKKKKIAARKAAKEAEKEKVEEMEVEEEEEVEREPTPPPPRKPPSFSSYTPIQLMQDHIIRKLAEKDPEQYFSFPVTQEMAPDYHEIIKDPMDLQTIREKIEDGKYATLPDMKADCALIVANAIQYNQPTTVFHLAARRLMNLVNYYFGEQYLRYLFHTLPSANKIPFELIGIRPLNNLPPERQINRRKGFIKDDMTSEDCLQSADVKVRDRLSARIPNLKNAENKANMGFLSERNGTVVLNVVAGTSSENQSEHQRRLTIGDIVGPLEEGTAGMLQLQEHRLFSQAPVNYLNYGPFSSFAPTYDSTWATMTKEDTDLFLRTYGDKTNALSASSMRSFVENCPEFLEVVDKKLNSLTDDEHSRTVKELEKPDRVAKDEEIYMAYEEYKNESVISLVNDVASLSNLGIDTGFLKEVKEALIAAPPVEPENTIPDYMADMAHMNVQQQLNHIGQELKDLAHIQENRLAQPPPTMLMNQAPEPGPLEQKLAQSVQQHLAHQMATHTAPEAFVNDAVLHDAIGIDMDDGDLFSEFFVTQ